MPLPEIEERASRIGGDRFDDLVDVLAYTCGIQAACKALKKGVPVEDIRAS